MRRHSILLVLAAILASPHASAAPSPQTIPHTFPTEEQREAFPDHQFAQRVERRVTSGADGAWRFEDRTWGEVAIWEYSARVDRATSMSLHVSDLALPGGARLHVGGDSGEEEVFGEGAIRAAGIWTLPQPGDTLHVRLEVPSPYAEEAFVTVSAFHAGFPVSERPRLKLDPLSRQNSYSCFDNEENRPLSRATVAVSIGGGGLCTGTLIDHPGSDDTPIVVSAAHCADDANFAESGLDPAESVRIAFNQISPCGEEIDIAQWNQGLAGVRTLYQDPVAQNGGDFWVFEVNDYPVTPAFMAGYDASAFPVVGDRGRAVHHARGLDQQFLSGDFDSIANIRFVSDEYGSYRRAPRLVYNARARGGASGAAVYDDNRRMLGVLSAGAEEEPYFVLVDQLALAMDNGLASILGARSSAGGEAPTSTTGITIDVRSNEFVVPSGGDIEITWTSIGANFCEAATAWSGPLALNGTKTIQAAENYGEGRLRQVYTVRCTSSTGQVNSNFVIVAVEPSSEEPPHRSHDDGSGLCAGGRAVPDLVEHGPCRFLRGLG